MLFNFFFKLFGVRSPKVQESVGPLFHKYSDSHQFWDAKSLGSGKDSDLKMLVFPVNFYQPFQLFHFATKQLVYYGHYLFPFLGLLSYFPFYRKGVQE